MPPIHSSATATAPSSTAQNTRCNTGESNLPPEVILSMTSEPESDDVIKNTKTNTTAITDSTLPKTSESNIWNMASETSVKPF
ncbi:Uncharacterised protein [Vibrio cholerae]|uniref:Uncharacterized protein n=1 Tax=Vibrio cholerae TaxID=666 RepID=A0A655V8E1_VIBCL|nr:Uncharacterised protein [Vibrio cholerae]CSA14918.1 Uncharacterised protein [Vibrio cholerae]CSB64042.1 Uncharacterised protein [Vibrio cholerae]